MTLDFLPASPVIAKAVMRKYAGSLLQNGQFGAGAGDAPPEGAELNGSPHPEFSKTFSMSSSVGSEFLGGK